MPSIVTSNRQKGEWSQSGSAVTVTFDGNRGFSRTYKISMDVDKLSVNGTVCYEKQDE